jgi:hypothetical protein
METRSNNLKRHVARMHPEVAPAVPEVAPTVPEVAPAVPEVAPTAEDILSCFTQYREHVVIEYTQWIADEKPNYVLSVLTERFPYPKSSFEEADFSIGIRDSDYFNYKKFQTLFPEYTIDVQSSYHYCIYKKKTPKVAPTHGYTWNKPDGSHGGFIECGCENQECSV